jgi:hypothetical protein
MSGRTFGSHFCKIIFRFLGEKDRLRDSDTADCQNDLPFCAICFAALHNQSTTRRVGHLILPLAMIP